MATIYRRGKSWWLRDGKFRKPLGTRSRSLAKLLLEDYDNEKLRPAEVLRLDAVIARYLDYIEPHNKPSHWTDKKRILKAFGAFQGCGKRLFHEFTEEPIVAYLTTRQTLSPYRWNTERQSIATLFNWGKKRNLYVRANPVGVIEKKKEPRGKAAAALTSAQIKKVCMVIRKKRDLLEAFQIALNTGLRVQEIENQQWTDLDLKNAIAKVQVHSDGWAPKDYEARIVPFGYNAIKIYRRRERVKALSPFVFPNAKGNKHGNDWVVYLGRAMRRAGIAHGGWHRTRHTFASKAMENGMSHEDLRNILGIADVKTLLKYVHLSESFTERVRAKLPKF